MKPEYRKPLALAAGVAIAALLYGLATQGNQLATTVNQITRQVSNLVGVVTGHDQLITERVIDLPEDGQTWSSVFVWPENREADPDSRRLAAAFASEPRLQSLLAQTKVFHYTPSDELFRERFAVSQPIAGMAVPQFWLIAPSENPSRGQVVYAMDGKHAPDGKTMAAGVAAAIARHCPRPTPTPPTPTPPTPPVTPPTPPDIGPAPDPVDESLPLWVWVLPVVAGGLGALAEWRGKK